jgi:hypothetical protein
MCERDRAPPDQHAIDLHGVGEVEGDAPEIRCGNAKVYRDAPPDAAVGRVDSDGQVVIRDVEKPGQAVLECPGRGS